MHLLAEEELLEDLRMSKQKYRQQLHVLSLKQTQTLRHQLYL